MPLVAGPSRKQANHAAGWAAAWDAMTAEALLLADAFRFAAEAHANQRRKGAAQEPYINHLAEVAGLVADATDGGDPEAIVAALLHDAGLQAPQVLEQDVAQGFLLLTDLGSRLYLNELNEARARGDTKRVDALMRSALSALVQWQSRADASGLPPYDEALLKRELALFPDWCVTREFGRAWNDAQQQDRKSVV